ncbi:MAG: hypothetical protein J7L96_00810 [Bacteroidales bacterium]|nr:hypothetical protein [Bacteroidales bacterium]
MDKTNLSMDWSAMPASPSYTLYYALADYKGDIDIDTLGSIDMSSAKSLYVPNLPSGLIIYAAIVAHAPGGDVVSNIVKFMGFGGTVLFPVNGAVLMEVDDVGGIGTLSVSGTRNADGSAASISQISGDTGSGPFVMQVTGDKPSSYKKGNATTTFIYHADGSVGLHTQVNPGESFSHVATYSLNDDIDCSLSKGEFEATLDDFHGREFIRKAKEKGFPFELSISLAFLAMRVKDYYLENKIGAYLQLLALALEGVKDEMLDDYDQQCNNNNNQSTINVPGNEHITIDFNCPIPDMASVISHESISNGVKFEYWTWNGNNVGPWVSLLQQADGTFEYSMIVCYDMEGRRNGWYLQYRSTDGELCTAIQYKNGVKDGHDYSFYPNGGWGDIVYQNGNEISSVYHAP